MADLVHGLEEPCRHCGRTIGDHTMREWSACAGSATTTLDYEDIPEDARALASRLGLPEGTILADNVIAKAVVLHAPAALGITVQMPAVIHEFAISPHVGEIVARVIYAGDPMTMRRYGRLIRDTANGAANAAERAA